MKAMLFFLHKSCANALSPGRKVLGFSNEGKVQECLPHYLPSVTGDRLAFQGWGVNSWPVRKHLLYVHEIANVA